jgi:histone H3/H4
MTEDVHDGVEGTAATGDAQVESVNDQQLTTKDDESNTEHNGDVRQAHQHDGQEDELVEDSPCEDGDTRQQDEREELVEHDAPNEAQHDALDEVEQAEGADGGGSVEIEKATTSEEGKVLDKKKKPLTAYFLFMQDYRAEHAAELKGQPLGSAAKKVGEVWKAMSEEEKQKYKDLAQKQKREYAETHKSEDKVEKQSGKKRKSGSMDIKPTECILPVATVKRIARKADKDIKNISSDALLMITKATEMFLQSCAQRTSVIAKMHNRKVIDPAFLSKTHLT